MAIRQSGDGNADRQDARAQDQTQESRAMQKALALSAGSVRESRSTPVSLAFAEIRERLPYAGLIEDDEDLSVKAEKMLARLGR